MVMDMVEVVVALLMIVNGEIKEQEYPKLVSKWNCMFCPFKEDKERCGEGIIY